MFEDFWHALYILAQIFFPILIIHHGAKHSKKSFTVIGSGLLLGVGTNSAYGPGVNEKVAIVAVGVMAVGTVLLALDFAKFIKSRNSGSGK